MANILGWGRLSRWGGVLAALFVAVGGTSVPAAAAIQADRYSEVKQMMQDLVARFPGNAELFQLGVADSGQMIEGLKIGSGPVNNLVVASHHGNEYGSTEVAKGFAASVAAAPLQGQSVYVIPVLNIEGYNSRTRWERAKGRSRDPNRDYPGPCGGEGPHHLKSTKLLADFISQKDIVSSATLHTFSPAVVYPWGFATPDLSTPYDDLFKMLTQAAVVESRYPTGNSAEAIYPANGTYEDYAFWAHGVWSLLFELGYSHSPGSGAVEEMVRVNVPGLRRFLDQAPRQRAENHGFSGRCDTRLLSLDRHDE